MEVTDGRSANKRASGDESPQVVIHRCSSDRVVFIEDDNSDAWIATDLTVDPTDTD